MFIKNFKGTKNILLIFFCKLKEEVIVKTNILTNKSIQISEHAQFELIIYIELIRYTSKVISVK